MLWIQFIISNSIMLLTFNHLQQFLWWDGFQKYWFHDFRFHIPIRRNVRKLRGTIVNIILPPRVLFHCHEIHFTAANFSLLPRLLFYCREFYFSTASFILLPRVLLYRREIYFAAASFIFTTAGFIFTTCSKIKLAVVKINSWWQNKTRGGIIKLTAVK